MADAFVMSDLLSSAPDQNPSSLLRVRIKYLLTYLAIACRKSECISILGGDKNIDEMSQIRDKRLPTSHVHCISAAPEATPLALRSIARHRIVEFG
eukprot:scaffold14428_cov87-Skeletonema_dohrnii-CCMP3373.AAC.1